MTLSVYISTSSYLDGELSTIFCREFNPENDQSTLKTIIRSRDSMQKLMALGDLQRLGSGETLEEVLQSSVPIGNGLPARGSPSMSKLVAKVRGSVCDMIIHFASEVYKEGGWVTLNPSKIMWPDSFETDPEESNKGGIILGK